MRDLRWRVRARRVRRRGRRFYGRDGLFSLLFFILFVFVLDSSFRIHRLSLLFFFVRSFSFGFETHIMTYVHDHDSMHETHSYGPKWFHCRL
jgi:hypothetical protein